MSSLASVRSFLSATLFPRCARHLLPLFTLALALPSLRAATFGDFEYTDTGAAITITNYYDYTAGAIAIPAVIGGKPVTSIGDYAFAFSWSLTSVTIPNSVTSIGNYAFDLCTGLTSLTIPEDVTSIGYGAFYYCSGLINVTISDGVPSIGADAFFGCSGLTNVTIPASVTSIGVGTFSYCPSLTNIDVASANPAYASVDGVLFTKTLATVLQFPGGKLQTSYTIPASVTSIGDSAFQFCSGLTGVTILDGVTSIGVNAFSGCTGLTSVTIPASVTSVGVGAFSYCTGLTNIDVAPANSAYVSMDGVLFTKTLGAVLQFPGGKLQTSYTIPASVTSIGDYTFGSCTGLTSVTIPASVTSIGDGAFGSCTGLTSMTIPASVTSIGVRAFSSCTGLTSVTIPNGVTSIRDGTFSFCTGLTSVTIPDGVTSVGDYTFYGCTELTRVTIPSNVTSIGDNAFGSCTGLTSVTIPASVASIGHYAFMNCSKLARAIFLGNAPHAFGDYVFGGTTTDFTIYYASSATGFTSPQWEGYNTQMGFPTFAQWVAGSGLAASEQLPESNPAGDGLTNLVKYALGLDPTAPATDGGPVLVSENGQCVLRFSRSLLTTGVACTVQTSTDLTNWTPVPATVESTTSTTETAAVVLPSDSPRRFARLVVTQP